MARKNHLINTTCRSLVDISKIVGEKKNCDPSVKKQYGQDAGFNPS
jgi:hypothetical protein